MSLSDSHPTMPLVKPTKATTVWLLFIAVLGSAILALLAAQFELAYLNGVGWMRNAAKYWVIFVLVFIPLALYLSKKLRTIQVNKKMMGRMKFILSIISIIVVPFILLVLTEVANQGITAGVWWALWKVSWVYIFRGWVWLIFWYALFFCVWGSGFAGTMTGLASVVLGIINYYKTLLRDDPIYPWDAFSLNTFFSVAGETTLSLTLPILLAVVTWLFFIALCKPLHLPWRWSFKKDTGPDAPQYTAGKNPFERFLAFILSRPGMKRLSLVVICLILVVVYAALFFFGPFAFKPVYWKPANYFRQRGVVTAFMTEMQSLSPKAPEGYSEETIREIMAKYDLPKADATPKEQPNIIMVMSESLFDVEERYPNVEYEKELLPNIRHLQETAVSGEILCPVFGGGTSQTEFETLTGFSMNYLATGVIPYTRAVTKDFTSDARILKSEGYEVLGMHPAQETNWNRSVAWPNMGIENKLFRDDFAAFGAELEVRGLNYTDYGVTDMIIDQYEQHKAKSDAPQYQFVVTMQNHGGYDHTAWPEDYFISFDPKGISGYTANELKVYATGIHLSDGALGELLDYFRQEEEPTIVVFYGDHQVALTAGLTQYNYLDSREKMTDEEFVDYQYEIKRTPFLIWDNYTDTQPQDLGVMGAYNLSPVLFDLYDLPSTPFYEFLLEVKEVTPGANKELVLHKDGSYSKDPISDEEREVLSDYEMIQYDYIYGKRYAEEWFTYPGDAGLDDTG